MVRIHGLAYIIIGAIVAAYSFFMGDENLQLFVWLGLAFLAFGLLRLLIDSKKTKGHKAQPQIAKKFCTTCGSAVQDFQNFCHNCGQRIFNKI